MINVNVHAVEFLPEKHRLTLLMDKSTCFCMLVRVFLMVLHCSLLVAWGSSDKPKKTCLASPHRDLEIKFPGKRSYKHWGNVYPTKKWFKIFKIYIIYDLLVYMGSKKAYAGINLGESGYSWNYAREI